MTSSELALPGAAARADVPPPPLPGFAHVKRYFDPRLRKVSAKILPGEFYVTTADEVVTTILGSCVSACVWDPAAGIGGMNHFMIPNVDHRQETDSVDSPEAGRYGVFAMELLINTILKHGGDRSRLLVKVSGGGHVVRSATTIGHKNVEFARRYLADEGLQVVGEHVEGLHARRLVFHPLTGRTKVLELSTREQGSVVRREEDYASVIRRSDNSGDIELF